MSDRMNDREKSFAMYSSYEYQQSCVLTVYFNYRIVIRYNSRDGCSDIKMKKKTTPSSTCEKAHTFSL